MTNGTLEVLLVGAKDLEDQDFFSKMDPYAILTYQTQEKKSSVASGQGCSPKWNETFLFTISDDYATKLRIKLMDKDTFTPDDFVGEAAVPLNSVFEEEGIPPMAYQVTKDGKYCGEIKVGLKFTPKQMCSDRDFVMRRRRRRKSWVDGKNHPWTDCTA